MEVSMSYDLKWLAVALLSSTVLLACGSDTGDGENQWLFGRWELAYNPANDDEDVLWFREDGSVVIETVNGREIPGRYWVRGQRLDLQLMLSNRPLEVSFTISPDHERLIYEQTGAYYEHASP